MIKFTTTITAVRVRDESTLENIVKEVDWVLEGSSANIVRTRAATTILADPNPDTFTPFDKVSYAQLSYWITESAEYIEAKTYIEADISQKFSQQPLKISTPPWWNHS